MLLHFLSRLKCAGYNTNKLNLYYTTCIKPLLEYACPVWTTNLTTSQNIDIEVGQIRTFCIKLGTKDFPHKFALEHLKLETLKRKKETLAKFFLTNFLHNSCLNDITVIRLLYTVSRIKGSKFSLSAMLSASKGDRHFAQFIDMS